MLLYLDPTLQLCFSANHDLFEQIMALRGECFRDQKGRITQRIQLNNQFYFIKQHRGIGWKECFKNLLQLRLPVVSARNEWVAIQALQALQIPVPRLMGFGERGKNPASRQSFIIMEELAPVISLETLVTTWHDQRPSLKVKRALIREVARIARVMHQAGINHRDFYICHFLLDQQLPNRLYLIDLHRAALRKQTPLRWIIKDLAGLYFSSKAAGLSKQDYCYFRQHYQSGSNTFWKKVILRGEKLYRDHQ